MKSLNGIAKAILAGLVAGLAALQVAMPDGITNAEWIQIVSATVAGFGFVWGVPNADPKPPVEGV